MPTIENKEIRGLSLRIIIVAISAIVTFVTTAAFFVGSIKSEISSNRELLMQIQAANHEDKRISDIRLKEVEQNQRTTDIRLTILETQVKDRR